MRKWNHQPLFTKKQLAKLSISYSNPAVGKVDRCGSHSYNFLFERVKFTVGDNEILIRLLFSPQTISHTTRENGKNKECNDKTGIEAV